MTSAASQKQDPWPSAGQGHKENVTQSDSLTFVQGILDGLVHAEDLLALEGGGSGDRDLVATNVLKIKIHHLEILFSGDGKIANGFFAARQSPWAKKWSQVPSQFL